MGMATLEDILNDVGSFVNQDPSNPAGTDLTSQVNLINQSQREWADAYQWKQLSYSFAPTVLLSMVSIGLPSNFKKLMSPAYDMSVTAPYEYQEIQPRDKSLKVSTDKYLITRGNDAEGWYIEINPALASGASLVMQYQAHPSSMVTLADQAVCPSRPYLATRTIAKILTARSDPRFPQMKADSDDLLDQMIEEEATPSGAENNRVPTYLDRVGFRIGED